MGKVRSERLRLFVDTNVLLDVLAHRKEFYSASAHIWSLAECGTVYGYVSAISFNNVYYIVRKAEDKQRARKALQLVRDVFAVVAPDAQIVNQAMDSQIDDFEDAVQFHSALRIKASCLVTRNPGHFPTSSIDVVTPNEFLAMWNERGSGPAVEDRDV